MYDMFRMMGSRSEFGPANYGQISLMIVLRKLWLEQVLWTRLFIISALSELPDLENATGRLMRNPSDFDDVLKAFYSRAKADAFRSLLEKHLKIGAMIVDNAKIENAKALEQYSKLWYRNADRIAAFLAVINPCWTEEEWKNLMYEHLRTLTDIITARTGGEFSKDIVLFDRLEEQALEMADVMAAGMIKQFDI
jgi:hypothetical protein